MKSISQRRYTNEEDLQSIVDLINASNAADHLEEETSMSELRTEVNRPRFDPARDLYLLWDEEARVLVGAALLSVSQSLESIDGTLRLFVHPLVRDHDLDPRIIAWAEARMQEAAGESSLPATLCLRTRNDASKRISLLELHGYVPQRYFLTMVRPLRIPFPEWSLPLGFVARSLTKDDAQPWVELFNQSFIDHYNHHPLAVENYLYEFEDPDYLPDLNRVAIAPDGTFAAFCYSHVRNTRNRRSEGWIDVLGTRRGFRNKGLGRAILVDGLRHLKIMGVESAKLLVDTESPTGAARLYESAGFKPHHTYIFYVKTLL